MATVAKAPRPTREHKGIKMALHATHRDAGKVTVVDVDYIDSSGIGELVSGFTAVKNRNGNLKLLHLTKKVRDLLQITKLFTVFDVYTDEGTAVRSFD